MPVWREIMADFETPVSAYLKVARGPYGFLLESIEGGERLARYSFIGDRPETVMRFQGGHAAFFSPEGKQQEAGDFADPLEAIRERLERFKVAPVEGLPRFQGGAVGYLSYETVGYFERLPSPEQDTLGVPEAMMLFTDTLLVFDHLRRKIKVVAHAHLDGDPERAYAQAIANIDRVVERLRGPVPEESSSLKAQASQMGGEARRGQPVRTNMSREVYEAGVRACKEHIAAGDCIQVVLAQRFSRDTSAHPFTIYRALRTINPSPYMYYLHLDDWAIVGASPEVLVRVEDGQVDLHPIAGTLPRGATPEEDATLEQRLLHDEKERAEHVMLVDLGRNDVGRVAVPGSVRVTQLMEVERYSHVLHLVSSVTGRLRPDLSHFEALRASFPAGTVSGAPKIRAMEIIAELEPDKRGPYAGAVGYFSYGGNLDTAIAIRTLVVKDGVAHVQAGGGIVADSVPTSEYQETVSKAAALIRAIDEAEELEAEAC